MNLASVMDELGGALEAISGLRVHPYTANRVTPPAAVVALPEDITYDTTYGRGSDRLTLSVFVLVGKVSDRASRDTVSAYADGSGSASVKAVLEAATYTACDSVRVTSATFEPVTVADVEYLSATFEVDIFGRGGQ